MQRKKAFELIKQKYSDFYTELNKKGKIVWDTEKGIYGAAKLDNVFAFFTKIKLQKYNSFIDLGSGDGCVVLIASLFTNAAGIEYDYELVKKSKEFQKELKLEADIRKADYLKEDLSKYDFIFINPDQGFHKGLEEKLKREMDKKARFFVYNMAFRPDKMKKGKTYWFNGTPVIQFY